MTAAVLFLALAAPADDALAVFKSRCASCHNAKKAKGKFGFVTDLDRIKADPKLLKKLGRLVADGDMPPEGEEPLTDAQKAAVRAWVEGGGQAQGGPTPLETLGRLHVVLVHFPVALAVMAAVAECWVVLGPARRRWWPNQAVTFCLAFGTLAALPAWTLGFVHAGYGNGAAYPALLRWHFWLGAVGSLALGVTYCMDGYDVAWGRRHKATRVMIFASAALVGLAGHFGGLLTHGADFLGW